MMMKLVCYRNWSITIHCESMRHDCGPSRYKATALLSLTAVPPRRDACHKLAGSPTISLSGPAFDTSTEANAAILHAAKREIEARDDARP